VLVVIGGWMDGWMGVKLVLRVYSAPSKITHQLLLDRSQPLASTGLVQFKDYFEWHFENPKNKEDKNAKPHFSSIMEI
jgi:hypothetical protein